MADQSDLNFTYTTIDKYFRLSIGENGDFSGAMYNGDYSLSLEEAQNVKHRFIVKNLNIQKGSKVLDMGCGWGPFLHYLSENVGADSIGLTLSEGQVKACRRKGMNVYLKDCRIVKPEDYGTFDAIVSLGAFEHFCSYNNFLAGRQEDIYKQFFKTVSDLLPEKGRFFLQTMVFGRNMVDHKKVSIKADKNSDEYILALIIKEFPGSWLPYGSEMLKRCSEKFFKIVSISSGRLDYIETIKQWRPRFRKFNFEKYLLMGKLLIRTLYDPDYRHHFQIFKRSPNKICFEREIMDHYRIVFEKI
ncbi:MAG: methyltransferase domain-containing protein [Saprospiraceae bacterium]|nr:methyltransferase domain-containing protein [Saprospiraceae bacterium]